jgi:hypothetical protein
VAGYQVAGLMGKTHLKAATVEVAVRGFHKTGLFPVERNTFNEHDLIVGDLEQPELSNSQS